MVDAPELPSAPSEAANSSVPLRKRFAVAVASAMGISAVGQALGFFRQILIAAFFGISRQVDIYLMAYVVANMIVFTFGSIFDSVAVPRLVQLRERHGEKREQALATAVFRFSWLIAVAASLAMLVGVMILAPIIASGFSAAERSAMWHLAWYFLPWTLLYVPYYAAAARHKATRNFNRVFAAEIVIGAVSIASLVSFHADITRLPLAYGAGYGAGLALLLSPKIVGGSGRDGAVRNVLRNVGELFVANQTGNIQTVVNRHFQSLVPVGGIAAIGYAVQLVNGLSALLLFREIFVVPLSETERRSEKLERLISGLLLLALPTATFIACFAPEIVRVLYQHGHFNAGAVELTAAVLRISVFGLIPSLVLTPLFRMFQIVDRIGLANAVYLVSSAFLLILGYILIQRMALGAPGIATMLVGNSAFCTIVTGVFVARAGITIAWMRLAKYAAFAAVVSIAAAALALIAVTPLLESWLRILVGGGVFGAVVFGAYFLIRTRLRRIISA